MFYMCISTFVLIILLLHQKQTVNLAVLHKLNHLDKKKVEIVLKNQKINFFTVKTTVYLKCISKHNANLILSYFTKK